MEVTKKEILKSMEIKRILQNIIIYFIGYLILAGSAISIMLTINPTWGLIMLTITSILFLVFLGYQIYRIFYLLSLRNKNLCQEVRIQKVNYYMSGKIPVFLGRVKTSSETKMVETNAIYKLKHVEIYQNKKVKALYDEKKNRIYILSLLD